MSSDIERVMQRDLDQLPLLPAERWVPAPARTARRGGALLRGAAVTVGMLVLALALGASLSRLRADNADRAAATSAPIAAATGAIPTRPGNFHAAAGFDLTVPQGWVATDRTELFNRRSTRLLVISKGPSPAADPQTGLVRWADLAADGVALELTEFSFPGGPGAETESTFPLDWRAAQISTTPDGQAPTLTFQHLLRRLTLTAHYGSATAAADRDALAAIVASIRPEPIPMSGVYRQWDVVGPLARFPIGSVQHLSALQPSPGGYFLVRGAHTVFAFIDGAYQFMGAMKPCLVRYDASTRTFVCDVTGDRWSRTGTQLTGGGFLGLGYHVALVKDGIVLVGGSTNGGGQTVAESAEFPDPAGPLPAAVPPTKQQVLDRYALITTTQPVERAEARLVTREQALASGVVRGASIPSDIERVWIVAFRGDVRIQGSGEVLGRWTAFYVDAGGGGAITMACCGAGEWPAGYGALPDLATP